MTGIEVAVGAVVAWLLRKGGRVAGAADREVDRALDAAAERVHDAVTTRLGADPALARLRTEADASGEPTERTLRRVTDALTDAAEDDADFQAELAAAVEAYQRAKSAAEGTAAPGTTSITLNATASGNARVYQAGRDQHINGS